MIYYPISALINAVASTVVCIIVITRNPKSQLNRSFSYFAFSVAFWAYCYFFWQISNNAHNALFWCRALMAGAIFIPSAFLHFSVSLISQYKKYSKIVAFWYIVSVLFFLLDFTPLFVKDVRPRLTFPYWPSAGITYTPFLGMFAGLTIYAHILMYKSYKRLSGFNRNQIKYVFLGTAIGFLGGSTNYPLWYGISIPPIGNAFVGVYVLLVAYSIVKYRLMDIKVALTRAGIFVVVYTLVLGIPFWIGLRFLGTGTWIFPVSIAVVLATLGPFIYIYLQSKAEARLLKEQRRYQDSLKQASAGMTRIRNLRKLLNLITHIVTKTVKIAYAGIYLYNKETNEYILQVSRDKGRMSIPKLTADNPLISWITRNRQPLIYEEVKRQEEDNHNTSYNHLEENMRLLTAVVVIPSFLEDRLVGLLVLGEKISGHIYTPEDLDVFQILASQTALAIENAQFYEETKEMQAQIAQAEKMATIGTMADGLSHQINNRFNALSLIAADTIDTVKTTDTSKCTPEVKEMIAQINRALERIQSNVLQGGQVVKGILKYTRKEDEGFEALTLDQILDATLEMVQYKVKLSEIDIIRDYPKNTPKIHGNIIQLQEVFFNFIDNAYDAMVERKTTLNEPGYRGKITISVSPKSKTLEIAVKDNGMGIKDNDSKKLFTPFFTTKVSSRRSTGLGLYVIKRLIEESHQGKIRFESEHKRGTTFVIELPRAKK
ncbi:MAG: GAF domain-containing protein [Candidatus Omnitrophica bacterium]|nr:GAF domain-containing protein [Candidatus Omnitrophota bacterium]MBU4473533.1 GAF domain-containing protein [Candidatus Omnitrophota bacterium]